MGLADAPAGPIDTSAPAPRSEPSRGFGAWYLPAAGLLALAAMALLHAVAPPLYQAILRVWMMDPWPTPFLDTRTVLGWAECHRQHGAAAYAPEMLRHCGVVGPMNYPPIWMHLPLPSPDWTSGCGLALCVAFLLSLRLLPRPARHTGRAVMLAATLSSATAFAVERANPDLLVWLLLLAAACAMHRSPARPRLGAALVALAASLKLYPIAGLILLWRMRWPARLALGAAVLLAVAGVAALTATEWGLRQPLPSGSGFLNLWGAPNAWTTLPIVLPRLIGVSADWPAWTGWCGTAVFALASLTIALRASRIAPPPSSHLLLGAALVATCFVAAQNVAYRGIFLLLVLPALLDARRRLAVAAILVVLWQPTERVLLARLLGGTWPEEALRWPSLALWLAQELAWWGILGTLAGSLLALVIRPGAGNTHAARAVPIRRSEA